MFIRSERLFLRPGWPEDWAELLALIDDELLVRDPANPSWPYTQEEARAFIGMEQDRLLPRFLITLPGATGAHLIGAVGLNRNGDDVELGYWIAREHWGQGYASEATRAVLSLARTLGHDRIVASHHVDNPASGRVLEKAGFRRTGRVIERFSKVRGGVHPAHEYELVLGAPSDCDDDSPLTTRRAA